MKTSSYKPRVIVKSLILCLIVLVTFGCAALSKIELDMHVDFPEMGGNRPLAHRTVYLLRDSIASPAMEEAFKKYMAATTRPASMGMPLKESDIRTRAGFMSSDGRAIWHKYIVESAETDFEGKATFRKLEPGDYWIYSIIQRPRGEWVLWNIKTTVKYYDTTKVSLSNENITFN